MDNSPGVEYISLNEGREPPITTHSRETMSKTFQLVLEEGVVLHGRIGVFSSDYSMDQVFLIIENDTHFPTLMSTELQQEELEGMESVILYREVEDENILYKNSDGMSDPERLELHFN